MDSIITGEKKCYVCGAETNLHCHHIFMGANRRVSEENGLKSISADITITSRMTAYITRTVMNWICG